MKIKAIALKRTTEFEIFHKIHEAGLMLGEFMYGTKERTWVTLAVTFGMLVLGISMMQNAASGGFCAVG